MSASSLARDRLAPQERRETRTSRARAHGRTRLTLVVGGLTALLGVTVLLSAAIGPIGVPITTTAQILWAHLVPGEHVAA